MAILGFLAGLLLMLGFYIVCSLMVTIFISYLGKKIVHILHYILSIQERIRKQSLQFMQRKQSLEKCYQRKKDQLKQKNRHRQQSFNNANTRIQLRHLGRETLKKLRCKQNSVTPEIQHSTKQAVKQCINQLDMERLIYINLSLSSPLHKLSHSQYSSKKINQTVHNE